MFDAAKFNPLSVFVMIPSSVPAADMETVDAYLRWYDIAHYLNDHRVLGVGEIGLRVS